MKLIETAQFASLGLSLICLNGMAFIGGATSACLQEGATCLADNDKHPPPDPKEIPKPIKKPKIDVPLQTYGTCKGFNFEKDGYIVTVRC